MIECQLNTDILLFTEEKVKPIYVVILFVAAIFVASFFSTGLDGLAFAQDNSPVETPDPQETPQPDPSPPVSDDPTPIPPTLLELLVKLIEEGGGWLTGLVLAGLGIVHKYAVSFVRKLFPNDEGTATKINGGIAELVSGLTSIATALIAFGVTWAIGFVSGLDLTGLLGLVGMTYVSGWSVHKINKLGKIAKA